MTVAVATEVTDNVVRTLRDAGCIFAEDEARILLDAATSETQLFDLLGRRAEGMPLEYVVGWAEFCGLKIVVGPGVFIPRRRSEFLAAQAIALVQPRFVVVDLCCGSGALAAAVADARHPIELYATDLDPTALIFARRNLDGFGARIFEGDLFDALPSRLRGRIDLVIANTPYVPTDDIECLPREARDHEPVLSLDGGIDGLAIQRRVASSAAEWLSPGGRILVELSQAQIDSALEAFTGHGFTVRIASSEELDATVVVAERPV